MLLKFWTLILISGILAPHAIANGSPVDWIRAADLIRNPSQSYEMKIKVETNDGESVFQVFMDGQDKTMIVTREPARDRGRNMLMLERDFHAYIPNLKRSMKLSLSQKLQGQVANGDISRTRWSGDYVPKLEKENAKERQLLLKGVKPNLTYAWIRLWLLKENNRPIRAEYLSLNGKTVLKNAYFEDYKKISGAIRPTTLRISDAANKTSRIRILSMSPKDFKESFFTIRNMETMK